MLSKIGAIGLGDFPYPKWHKREKENILKAVGVKVEYGSPSESKDGRDMGSFTQIGDVEHGEIVSSYQEMRSMVKVASKLDRSSGSVYYQIKKHNRSIEKSGICLICKRVSGEFSESKI